MGFGYPVTGERYMSISQLLQSKRSQIIKIAARHGAQKVRVFGSVVRGDARPDSDIDFLVDMEGGRSLLDLVKLCQDLEELLHRKVDVPQMDEDSALILNSIFMPKPSPYEGRPYLSASYSGRHPTDR